MPYSTKVLEFKDTQKQIKALLEQRKQILQDMLPDIENAITSMMDWKSVKVNSIDATCGSILMSVENPAETVSHRYVFGVKLLEHDEFRIDLQFREEFKPSYY